MHATQNDTEFGTFLPDAAMEPFRRVKLLSTLSRRVTYADAGEKGIGVTQGRRSAGAAERISVKYWNSAGSFKIEAGGVTAVNATLYGADDGKVDDVVVGSPLMIGLDAGVDGGIVEGLVIHEPAIDGVVGSMPNTSTTSAADSLAIPITHGIVVKTTGGDAEALTLANGTAGQELIIHLGTDGGGTGTLTPATCTGFATIVFADAGDTAVLKYIDDTIGWVIHGLYGIAAPPAVS